ncbi:Nif11-like leader peptide family natural product precursor [Solidesulfovibrio sp.]|uniref:Nif11-like leader peptide family natural product precursor n=1 Tax=Solidesulfovibrio sp. TaxID=2910990 RepID=UPI00262D89E8|nr:Nif11-like leader peptide family natural product precursor [Solidesulfovibrio sp.]
MSLQSAMEFVNRLREDQAFRWALGECRNKWERRRFVITEGYRFSPAELVCATSPGGDVSDDRTAVIERVRRQNHGHGSYAFM